MRAHDYSAGGKPPCAWDDPAARNELVTGLVTDALAVLERLEGVDLDEDQAQLVALLALVAGQDVEPDPDRGEGSWRIARKVAKDRVISTVDPETRHMHKSRSNYRDGYKAHIAVEPDTGIITGVDLTPANSGDGPTGVALLAGEEPGLDVLADSAYGSGQVRHDLGTAGHTAVIKPWPLARNPKLGTDQFARDDFTIDYRHGVTCPEGHRSSPAAPPASVPVAGRRSSGAAPRGRRQTFKVTDHDQLLAAARADWHEGIGIEDYRRHRPMVERSLAWLVANNHRRVRYRGSIATASPAQRSTSDGSRPPPRTNRLGHQGQLTLSTLTLVRPLPGPTTDPRSDLLSSLRRATLSRPERSSGFSAHGSAPSRPAPGWVTGVRCAGERRCRRRPCLRRPAARRGPGTAHQRTASGGSTPVNHTRTGSATSNPHDGRPTTATTRRARPEQARLRAVTARSTGASATTAAPARRPGDEHGRARAAALGSWEADHGAIGTASASAGTSGHDPPHPPPPTTTPLPPPRRDQPPSHARHRMRDRRLPSVAIRRPTVRLDERRQALQSPGSQA